jgi:hypothetical protein
LTGEVVEHIREIVLNGSESYSIHSNVTDGYSHFTLSTNDYTNADMEKLRSLTNADVNKAYVDTQLAKKANASHTHSEYLTEHQDISGKVNKMAFRGLNGINVLTFGCCSTSIPYSLMQKINFNWSFL